MGFINFENGWFCLTDGYNNKTPILKRYDPLNNYSSLPVYETDGGKKYPMFDVLTSIFGDFDRVNEGVAQGLDKTEVQLCVLLITKALLKKHRDFKVLEIGCDNGALSFSLARLLKAFNPKNQLICVTDAMSMNRNDRWHDKIFLSGAEEIVSLVTTPYESTLFPRDYFDIVILNGSAAFEDPGKVIYNAVNFIKNNGLLIALPASQYLLSSCFQVIAENCDEFYLNSVSSVLVKTINKKDKYLAYKRTEDYKVSLLKQDIVSTFVSLKKFIENLGETAYLDGNHDLAIDEQIRMVMRAENDVLTIFSHLDSLDIKFNINELKESLISYRLCHDESERKHFAAVCSQKYQAVICEMRKYADFLI